jgi:predicted NBD/HSP70 family sugar kinase
MAAAPIPSRPHKRAALLRALRRSPGASRTALAGELGFSLGTAQILVDDLLDEGIVCPAGVDLGTGGRPSRRLSLNPDGPLVMGVDLSQMEMRLGLFDLNGERVATREAPLVRRKGRVRLDRVIVEIEQLAALEPQRLVGVGLAVPGYLDISTGRVLFSANLGWRDVDLGRAVRDALSVDALVARNTNAAMLAETWSNPAASGDPAVFVTMGSGIGGAIQTSGRFLHGVGGAAGELGHIVVDPEGPRCRCGRRGCLETLASAKAIQERYARLKGAAPSDTAFSLRSIGAAAASGEPEAQESIETAVTALVEGLATLVTLINPEVIILGGDLLHAHPSVLGRIRDGVNQRALAHMARQVRIEVSRLHEDAPLVGAACLVHEALFAGHLHAAKEVS